MNATCREKVAGRGWLSRDGPGGRDRQVVGKRLIWVGIPVILLATCTAMAGPLMIYSAQFETQTDPNVVVLNSRLARVEVPGTSVKMGLYVWLQDFSAVDPFRGEPNIGVRWAWFGVGTARGGLLGNLSWSTVAYWQNMGYLRGANVDIDGDGDRDIGGIYHMPYTDMAYDSNFADFPAVVSNLLSFNFWANYDSTSCRWVPASYAVTKPAVKGPDGNVYYGFKIGTMSFGVSSAAVHDQNTYVQVFPYFLAGPAYRPHQFEIEGRRYCLGEPLDPNYSLLPTKDPNMIKMYVTDPRQFGVQADTPLVIYMNPEPTVLTMVLLGAGLAMRRRRR